MANSIMRRVMFAIFTIIIAATLGFIVIEFAPTGDYVPGDSAGIGRYFGCVWGALCWNFGISTTLQAAPSLGSLFVGSMGYALLIVFASLAAGGVIGIFAAINIRRGWAGFVRVFLVLCLSLPGIVIALPVVIMFNGAAPMFLITIALCVSVSAYVAKAMLEQTREVMRLDYVKAAYSRGIPINKIIHYYIIPNTLPRLIKLFVPVWSIALVVTAGFECVFFPAAGVDSGRFFSLLADFYKSGYVTAAVGMLLFLTNITVVIQLVIHVACGMVVKNADKRVI